MSQNLDLVRSIYADWERGDFRSLAWADADIEFLNPDGPTPSHLEGSRRDDRRLSRDFLDTWEDFTIEVEEYRAIDDGRILVLVHHSGHGKTSGVSSHRLEGERICSTFATARWSGSSPIGTATAPSPTSAWRARRCRRGTWSWSGVS